MSSKYRIIGTLGAGGMGKIYKGLLVGQGGFQRPIVVKQLRDDDDDPSHLRLFVEEARRYALLDHENIGRILDFERVDGQLCIILEYIDGWSLVEFLERHLAEGRFPDVELTVFIVSRVCRALQYVYERAAIAHRDVSPSNIMMTREGTVKLIDFGIATRSGTRSATLTGKPAYMAPEMVVELRADDRSDIFSLGAVFYEMLALQRLFGGSSTAEVLDNVVSGEIPLAPPAARDLPEGVLAILRRALQRDPQRRYASAGEMGVACEHYLYDKGYGPTNLTLKRYLQAMFGDRGAGDGATPDETATIDPALLRPVEEPAAHDEDAEPDPEQTRRSIDRSPRS
jgi:serine/threonine-protein kinase